MCKPKICFVRGIFTSDEVSRLCTRLRYTFDHFACATSIEDERSLSLLDLTGPACVNNILTLGNLCRLQGQHRFSTEKCGRQDRQQCQANAEEFASTVSGISAGPRRPHIRNFAPRYSASRNGLRDVRNATMLDSANTPFSWTVYRVQVTFFRSCLFRVHRSTSCVPDPHCLVVIVVTSQAAA